MSALTFFFTLSQQTSAPPVDDTLRVVSVEETDAISVAKNTSFFQVDFQLPITRLVTLSDDTVVRMPVRWIDQDFDGATDDDYIIQGELTLPDNVANGDDIMALVTVTVTAALSPTSLANQVLWLREDNNNTSNNVDNWNNKYNSSNDLVKITDARRPNVNATGIDSLPSYDFTLANADVLRGEAGLGLSGDFTIYAVIKVAAFASNQLIFQNTDNDTVAGNTGIQLQARSTSLLWADFRKNVSGQHQRVEWPYTSTSWSVITMKHDANGAAASTNIVKQDGALIKKTPLMEPVVHNSNKLKLGGNGFDTATPFGGSIAEIILTSDFHNDLTGAQVIDYLKTRYPTQLSNLWFFREGQFSSLDALTEAWNGLDALLRSDGKYDFIGGTLTGKIYYFEQGATVNDWTATLIKDTSREIQSLKVFGRTAAGRLVILSAHKDSSSTNDNIGKIMVHYADSTDDQGAYTSGTPITAHDYPQQIVVHDIDGDGENEFIFSFQGNGVGEGGVSWFKFTDVDAPLGGGTEHVCIQHSGAWWVDGPYEIDGVERWIFSARNNRNPGNEVPGLYYLTPASPVTNTWARTTIDNTALDFGHWDIGNFFGNDNDLIIQSFSNDDIYAYNAASSFAKSTIVTGGTSSFGTQIKVIPGYSINSRSCFLSWVELDWAYLVYYNGSAWTRKKLMQTGQHPADNEVFFLDVDNSGYLTVVFDDNTGLANAHVYKFKL